MLPPQEKTPMTGTLLRGKAGRDGGDRTGQDAAEGGDAGES